MSGAHGWILTAGVVAAWDILADETMSSAFERGCKRRGTRPAVVAAWALLTAHLFSAIPEPYDPFVAFLHRAKRRAVVA